MTLHRPKNRRKKPGFAQKRDASRASSAQVAHHVLDKDQRVHLILTHAGPHGKKQLQLTHSIFEREWQNRLALATARTAFSALEHECTTGSIMRLGQHAGASLGTLIAHQLSQAQPAIACTSGCDHCCHQRVGATPVEAIAIAGYLAATCTAADLADLRERLGAFVDKTRALSAQERYSPDHACPLLKDHKCLVYPVRPLACRGVHSFDQKACESELRDPEIRQAFLRGDRPGHAFREPLQAVHAVSAGLQLALSERFALDMRPLDLAHALLLLLDCDTSLGAAQQWLDGLPALSQAKTDQGPGTQHDPVFKHDLGLV